MIESSSPNPSSSPAISAPFDVASIRSQFPALCREVNGHRAVYFDGPAGTQVPTRVINALVRYLTEMNANHGGFFATSQASDQALEEAHQAAADLLGAADPQTVFFGQNMTSLAFAVSHTLSRQWKAGDEILVTRLDHDANVSPWVQAAQRSGAVARHIDIHPEDCTLNLDDLRQKLSERTRLVAVGCASNAVGTINPVAEIAQLAHQVGALVFLDAVHYAPHAAIDVMNWGCDLLACSAYKFYGPHLGLLWGRRELLESLEVDKVRPAPDTLPGRMMTGTQSHEAIFATAETVEYLADLGREVSPGCGNRRAALLAAYQAINSYEMSLLRRLLDGLAELPEIRVYGITDPSRFHQRVSTISFTHARRTPGQIARYLGDLGIFVWHGNYYALPLTERLGLEPQGMVRVGLVHYNTPAEVERLLEALRSL